MLWVIPGVMILPMTILPIIHVLLTILLITIFLTILQTKLPMILPINILLTIHQQFSRQPTEDLPVFEDPQIHDDHLVSAYINYKYAVISLCMCPQIYYGSCRSPLPSFGYKRMENLLCYLMQMRHLICWPKNVVHPIIFPLTVMHPISHQIIVHQVSCLTQKYAYNHQNIHSYWSSFNGISECCFNKPSSIF